ncbi:2-amino-5-chloromuconate deaminase CnbZ [Roseomonas fluvialis]|uniref:Uncharacterized protein n=1 Tax=Roseomonas fluvialis TaxID=1750527 RepID=A0ABN6P4S6_9PROT|nr:hypothetical protein [Roseomonas fluvialis]BDG72649.1 hypothetical protein Rmf_25780 [Roseomonas fluvialis]
MSTIAIADAGYRFIPAVMQYSGGVAALPGFRLERARFAEPLPMAEGWRRIAAHLSALGRPLTAFAACELRSPAPFTEAGFATFNAGYAKVLGEWGVLRDGANPVARSNVCPRHAPPAEPCFHAFVYTVPDAGAASSFAVAGSGESAEGKGTYRENTIAYGDTSPAGMLKKGLWVLGEMERRMGLLGHGWADTTGVQAYTIHPLPPALSEAIVNRGAARHGLTWQDCRPPVEGLEYEMDCRGIGQELVLPG